MCSSMFRWYRGGSSWTARSGNDWRSPGKPRHGRRTRRPGRNWSRSCSTWTNASNRSPRVRERTSSILASSPSPSSRRNKKVTSELATLTQRSTPGHHGRWRWVPRCGCIASVCRWTSNLRGTVTLPSKSTRSFRTMGLWWTSQMRRFAKGRTCGWILPSWRYCLILPRSTRRRTRTAMERWFHIDRFREGQKQPRWNATTYGLGNLRYRARLCCRWSITTMHTSGIVGFLTTRKPKVLHLLRRTHRYNKASSMNVLHSILRLSIRHGLPMKARTKTSGAT